MKSRYDDTQKKTGRYIERVVRDILKKMDVATAADIKALKGRSSSSKRQPARPVLKSGPRQLPKNVLVVQQPKKEQRQLLKSVRRRQLKSEPPPGPPKKQPAVQSRKSAPPQRLQKSPPAKRVRRNDDLGFGSLCKANIVHFSQTQQLIVFTNKPLHFSPADYKTV